MRLTYIRFWRNGVNFRRWIAGESPVSAGLRRNRRDWARARVKQSLAVKTFEDLFAELGDRARTGRPAVPRWRPWTPACTRWARRSWRRPARCGWPPSTNPTTRWPRRSAGALVVLDAGVDDLARVVPRRCLSEVVSMLRVAVPNKGTLSEPASEILSEGRLSAPNRSQRPDGHRPRQPRRVLLPSAQRHRHLCRRPRRLDFGMTGRDLVRDSDSQVRERLALGFGSPVSELRRSAGRDLTRPTWPGNGLPPPTPIWSERIWPPEELKRLSSGSTAPWRFQCNSGSPTPSPTWSGPVAP